MRLGLVGFGLGTALTTAARADSKLMIVIVLVGFAICAAAWNGEQDD